MFEAISKRSRIVLNKGERSLKLILVLAAFLGTTEALGAADYHPVFQQGNAALAKKDYDDALIYYRSAEEIDPEAGQPVWGEADCLYTMGRKQEALVAYRRAADLLPDTPVLDDRIEKVSAELNAERRLNTEQESSASKVGQSERGEDENNGPSQRGANAVEQVGNYQIGLLGGAYGYDYNQWGGGAYSSAYQSALSGAGWLNVTGSDTYTPGGDYWGMEAAYCLPSGWRIGVGYRYVDLGEEKVQATGSNLSGQMIVWQLDDTGNVNSYYLFARYDALARPGFFWDRGNWFYKIDLGLSEITINGNETIANGSTGAYDYLNGSASGPGIQIDWVGGYMWHIGPNFGLRLDAGWGECNFNNLRYGNTSSNFVGNLAGTAPQNLAGSAIGFYVNGIMLELGLDVRF